MSPSRGTSDSHSPSISPPNPNSTTPPTSSTSLTTTESSTDLKADTNSSSALRSAKRNLHYLFAPNSPLAPRPAHLRTRALLRSIRYIGIFIFWRIVRYAKYALVGSIVAALGATAFGGAISGVGFLLAPPTLLTSVGIGAIWAMGKWGFRKVRGKESLEKGGEREVKASRVEVKRDGGWRGVQGPNVSPW